MSSVNNSLQIWDNAAFDDSLGPAPGPLQPISLNLFDAAGDHRPLKENRGPAQPKKPSYNIDAEIADIEAEIGRLSKKLEVLKLKKAQQTPASAGPTKRGRIVPAKFLNLETPPPSSSKKKVQAQDPAGRRRGLSLGPAEISQNAAPWIRPQQKPSLQKKLEGIKEEEKGLDRRRRGMSLGPSEILRQTRPSIDPRGIATVGSKKLAPKMDNGSLSIIKPKALFGEKKRPLKARIVASRYNEEKGSKRRKWSLPEAEKEAEKGEKKRALSLGGGNKDATPSSVMKIAEGLPRIRTGRGVGESPRDSGCAKRVAELVGRKSIFAIDDGCQSLLNFEDEGMV